MIIYPVQDHYKHINGDVFLGFYDFHDDFIYKLTQIGVLYTIQRMLYSILGDMSPPQLSLRIAGHVPSPLFVDILS